MGAAISPPPADVRLGQSPHFPPRIKQACVALVGCDLGAYYWSRAGLSYFNTQLLTGLFVLCELSLSQQSFLIIVVAVFICWIHAVL